MGQESCFFFCLFVFFYLAQSRQEEKKEGSITVLLSFCEFLVLVMVTHSAWRNLFLIPPTAPFCSKTPSLIFFFHALSCSIAMCPHSFLLPNMESLPSFSFELSAPRRQARRGGALWRGGGGENIVARMSTPTHVHRQWTHMHSFTPPQKTQYNIPHARTHTTAASPSPQAPLWGPSVVLIGIIILA